MSVQSEIESGNKRKTCTDLDENSEKAKSLKVESPFDEYFKKMKSFISENNFIGSLLIRGLTDDDDEDEYYKYDNKEDRDAALKKKNQSYTEEEMNSLRSIMISENRENKLENMRRLILGKQADDSIQMFNTSFSYEVVDSLIKFRKLYNKLKTPAEKFDLLFGYTFNLSERDVWMHDYEDGEMINKFTKSLALMWKTLLKNPDVDLGIDIEYTKPALTTFLTGFKESVEHNGDAKFKFE
jgi:hypothetical protein